MDATSTGLSRRDFLKTTGGAGAGLALWFAIPWDREPASAADKFEPNALLTITPDGIITVHITKAEMGQGIGTAMAQIVAEELEADWQDIRIDYPINDPKYGFMGTGGSRSVSGTFDALSRAGAAARIMLLDAAARRWNVPPEDCVAERGVVRHPPTQRSIAYGEIVAKLPITKTLTPEDLKRIPLKKPSEYKVIGKWVPRLDIPEKTTGQAKFGIDVFLPGMVYAKVAYPPTREGGRHLAVEDSAAKQVKGYVQTVVASDLVAVLADSYEAAVKARDALKITWDPGPHARVSTASILQDYERKVRSEAGVPWVNVGDVRAGMAQSARVHSATYTTDFIVHAQMEPMNCVARFEGGVLEIFTGTQLQTRVAGLVGKRLGLDPSKIRIHQQYLGGGFGRRLEGDIVIEAGIIAKEAGRPIKLIRSREEDLRRGYYRSISFQTLKAGLDASSRVMAWEHAVVTAYPRARGGASSTSAASTRSPSTAPTMSTTCRTSWFGRSRARPGSPSATGARSRPDTPSSRWRRFSTSWRAWPRPIPSSTGWPCWQSSRGWPGCSSWPRGARAGGRPCRPTSGVASRAPRPRSARSRPTPRPSCRPAWTPNRARSAWRRSSARWTWASWSTLTACAPRWREGSSSVSAPRSKSEAR
ncbi:MAG: molybdopterin-dependent oxidoreductase [Candidatus Rokubacteria bacterium]|nr:molybdopterin-dependent oxidoreductase [Candidatus Rokubacteria bacterium]